MSRAACCVASTPTGKTVAVGESYGRVKSVGHVCMSRATVLARWLYPLRGTNTPEHFVDGMRSSVQQWDTELCVDRSPERAMCFNVQVYRP